MRLALVAVLLLFAFPVKAAPARSIFVVPSPLSKRFEQALAEELAPPFQLAKKRSAAALVVEVASADALVVRIYRGAKRMMERKVSLKDGEGPAVRVAVLLVVELVSRTPKSPKTEPTKPKTESATTNPTTEPEEVRTSTPTPPLPTKTTTATQTSATKTASVLPPGEKLLPAPPLFRTAPAQEEVTTATAAFDIAGPFGVFAGLSLGWWQRPGAPQLGPLLGAHVAFGRVRLGARGFISVCCSLEDPGRLTADPLSWWLVAESELALYRATIELGLSGGVGLAQDRVSALPVVFKGNPVEETVIALSPIFRLGFWGRIDLGGGFGLEAAIGLIARVSRLSMELPYPFETDQSDVDPGLFMPWLELVVLKQI